MKRIEIDGEFYRERRGKLVKIPAEWVGQIPHAQTMRKRGSRKVGQQKNIPRNPLQDGSHDWRGYREQKYKEI
jgi:hypothetical protein